MPEGDLPKNLEVSDTAITHLVLFLPEHTIRRHSREYIGGVAAAYIFSGHSLNISFIIVTYFTKWSYDVIKRHQTCKQEVLAL